MGASVNAPADIRRLAGLVGRNSMDLLQAVHTWSGIEIALWDLLGKMRSEPVWRLLGYNENHPKLPYASMLLGNTPQETLDRARIAASNGFRAVKFGWGSYGTGSVSEDADHVAAAREGLGDDAQLLIDAGQIWGDDVDAAIARLEALERCSVTWLEEPFVPHAFAAHAALAAHAHAVGIAGGEGAHTVHMATNLIDYGRVRFIQVDAGRIGGIGPAKVVADHAVRHGTTYVNHTFTSHLALSASLQAFAGLSEHRICEYPVEPKPVALAVSSNHILPDANGEVRAPDAPGLGIDVDLNGLAPYLREVEILIDQKRVYSGPTVQPKINQVV